MLTVLSEADIDGIFGQIKPHVKASIPKQVKVMQSTKVLGNIKEACENSYYVRPWRFRGCWGSTKHGRCMHQIWKAI